MPSRVGRRCAAIVVPFLFAIASGAKADTTSPAEDAVIAQAIQVLSDYDKCCKTASPAGFAPGITVSDCLKSIGLSGNFCSKDLGPRGFGGKTLDERSANCADKDVVLLAIRMLDSGKKGADFIDLLATLYHEGTHALQDLSAVVSTAYHDKVMGPLEVQAWSNEKLFLEQFKAALQKLRDNLQNGRPADDGMTACQKKLMACYLTDTTLAQIEAMIAAACAAIALETATVDGIAAWLARNCPPAPPAEGAPRDARARDSSGTKRAHSVPDEPTIVVIEIPLTGISIDSFSYDSGLDQILGLAFQANGLGVDHLVASGVRGGAGFVQVWHDTTPSAPGGYALLAEHSTGAGTAPSGLVPGPGDTLLLWDESNGQIRAMLDGDLDGVVDTYDPMPRYGVPIDPTGFLRISHVGPGEYWLQVNAIGTMTGNLPVIRLIDVDGDGFFQPTMDDARLLRPLDDERQTPNLCTRAFEFQPFFVAIGAPGHPIELHRTDANGTPLGLLAPPAFAGPEGEAVFNVNPPGFQPGTFARLRDAANGRWSAVYPVIPPQPVIYPAIGNVGPGVGGTEVVQMGAHLDQLGILNVLVGGQPAASFEVLPNRVTYVTPPNVPVPGDGITDHGLHVDVRLVYDDGTSLLPATLEAQPFAYLDPILLPEYDCRKGNVNAGAGPIADVLFVNGSAGIGAARRVYVASSDPFALSIVRPPSKPSGTSKCCVYAWAGEGSGATVMAQPSGLGMMCRATPLNAGAPGQPKKIANSIGFPAQLGAEDWPGPPTAPAPATLLSLGAGLGRTGTFLFQGFIIDSAAPNGQAAVTNAVVVVSE